MEDILLMQFLKKKGVISDRDMHEFHELVSSNMENSPIYLTSSSYGPQDSEHISEQEAKDYVAGMYHTENGRKYVGEKFDIYKAKEVCERYRGILPLSTVCDVYIAINLQYHNYAELFKAWFGNDIEQKIIESAIVYWFRDDNCPHKHKYIKQMIK